MAWSSVVARLGRCTCGSMTAAREVLDATCLWGKGAYDTGELLLQAHGEKTRFVTTGVAGENRVRSAIIFGSHESTSCAGFGAVMGSKKLKAIAVKGAGRPTVADPKKLKELNRYTIAICNRVTLEAPPIVTATNHAHLVEVIGKGHCDHCGLTCNRQLYRYGKRLEGGAVVNRWNTTCRGVTRVKRNRSRPSSTRRSSRNGYSIGTFELQNIVDWLYACHQGRKPYGGRYGPSPFQNRVEGIPGKASLLDVAPHRLWRRPRRRLGSSAGRVPQEALDMMSNTVAPTGQYDTFPARAMVAHALLYPMEPRIHQSILHEIGFVRSAWALNQVRPDLSPVTTKVVHDVARVFWGSEEAGDLSRYEGKALAARKIQNRSYLKDSLGLCDFAWPITYSFSTPDHLGDPDLGGEDLPRGYGC